MKVWCELYIATTRDRKVEDVQKYNGDNENWEDKAIEPQCCKNHNVARYTLLDKQHADVQIR